jgi:hypothetical protein
MWISRIDQAHVSFRQFGPTDWTAEWRDWETVENGAE